jgi:hypothetical protein
MNLALKERACCTSMVGRATSRPDFLDIPEMKGSFGLANYYIHMPWTWARFQATSMISGKTEDGQRP